MTDSPFHAGEQAVQSRLGVRASVEPWAQRVVRDHLPAQHREFYAALPFVVAAARDTRGRPWATVLTGTPGFVDSPDDRRLEIRAAPAPGDALEHSITTGTEMGLLGIDLRSRRRNRMNGRVTAVGTAEFRLDVHQAFGNCPQYITERAWSRVGIDRLAPKTSRYRQLDAAMRDWITAADTFFIASGYRGQGDSDAFGMDASHRGGTPGFVSCIGDNRIVFPDYAGNNHFNTIGNLVMDRRVGLLFVDFEQGSVLQIAGEATIDWDEPDTAKYPGARRLVIVDIDEILRHDRVLPLRWTASGDTTRPVRVARRTPESDNVVSLELVAQDAGELATFRAGQHLPVELHVKGTAQPLRRMYSLSNAPGQGSYRISIKREPGGLASSYLHDDVQEGGALTVRSPAGGFVLERTDRPVVLLGAGIGITPLLSMLHQLTAGRTDHPVILIYGTRDGAHHPFGREVADLVKRHPSVNVHVAYSRPRARDRQGIDYHQSGRITPELIRTLTAGLDADYYLCGPTGFLAGMLATLDAIGVEPARIRTESFRGN